MTCKEIKKCRICGNENLVSIIDLGQMALTGVFPGRGDEINSGPLELVKCYNEDPAQCCGLVQLRHTYDSDTLYGDNYGYRSGLNGSMVRHLGGIVKEIEGRGILRDGDLVVDIASNDGTLLAAYENHKLQLVGIDPTVRKFGRYYQPHIKSIPDFFSSELIKRRFDQPAKVVTSVAMFYDLEDPTAFMRQVAEILDDEGIWVMEQSYMPTMIARTAYDTICHEHLEYYALKQIDWMARSAGLKIADVSFNDANGGSFRVTLAKESSPLAVSGKIEDILEQERRDGFDGLLVYKDFWEKISQHRISLVDFIKKCKTEGKVVFGYGASTKGNVILQFCGLGAGDIACIAEVNEDKFGRLTPGSNIPIISEQEARLKKPDYFLVLPWHFKDNIMEREKAYLAGGGKLFFPLPFIEIF